MKNLTYKELVLFKGHALHFLNKMHSTEKFPGDKNLLTDGDRVAVAYFRAALVMLNSMGLNTEGFDLVLETPDSNTIFEE